MEQLEIVVLNLQEQDVVLDDRIDIVEVEVTDNENDIQGKKFECN